MKIELQVIVYFYPTNTNLINRSRLAAAQLFVAHGLINNFVET